MTGAPHIPWIMPEELRSLASGGMLRARPAGGVLGRIEVPPGRSVFAGHTLTMPVETAIAAVLFTYVRGPFALCEIALGIGPEVSTLAAASLTRDPARRARVLAGIPMRVKVSEAFRVSLRLHESATRSVCVCVAWSGAAIERGPL